MEEEIDLYAYFEVLARRWRWIAGLTVASVVVALGVSLALPPIYRAEVAFAVPPQSYVLRFEPRFEALPVSVSVKDYSSLVKTQSLEREVFNRVSESYPSPPAVFQAEDLDRMAEVLESSDSNVFLLRVEYSNPEFAAFVANTWAQLYVSRMEEVYGAVALAEFKYSQQLEPAAETLREVENDLIQFEGRSRINILTEEIEAKKAALRRHLAALENLERVKQDAEVLQQQLLADLSSSSSLIGDLSLLIMQVSSLTSEASIPVEIQLTAGRASLLNLTSQEQMDLLDNLLAALEEKRGVIELSIADLQPELLRLQRDFQEEVTEKERLTRARDLAYDNYASIARKLSESRIAAQSEGGGVRIASPAPVPDRPASSGLLQNMALATALGFFVGIFAAFGWEFFQAEQRRRAVDRPLPSREPERKASGSTT